MPSVLVRRTRMFTNDECLRLEQHPKAHPALLDLCTSWACHGGYGGNISRVRRTNAVVAAQAELLELPVVVSIPRNMHDEVAAVRAIPAEFRDGHAGYCITRFCPDGVPENAIEEVLPPNALLPFVVVAHNQGTEIAVGKAYDRTSAKKLLGRMRRLGVTNIDLKIEDRLVESIGT